MRFDGDISAGLLELPEALGGRLQQLSLGEIRSFAADLGIAPGIVVGRMQKEGFLAWSQGNTLNRRFKFVEDETG
jgi:HTH-type transcriptional regulator/antitoxin HigA